MRVSTHLIADREAVARLPVERDSDRTLVLAFGPSADQGVPEVVAALSHAFPRSVVAGCSTAGQIHERTLQDRHFSVAVASFDAVDLVPAVVHVASARHSRAAAGEILAQVSRPDLRALLVLADGLSVDASEFVRGINAAVPPGVIVTGGLAGDGSRLRRAWVMHDGRAADRVVAAIGLAGDRVVVGHGTRAGWEPFGPERVVTRAEGATVFEFDGRPALRLYEDYLGSTAAGLPWTGLLLPVSLMTGSHTRDCVLRSVLAVDETSGAVTFAGDVPQGSRVRLMRASADRLVQGASQAGFHGQAQRAAGPVLAVAISGVGRRVALGERTEEEIEATLDALPPVTRQVGFYAYGEIGPGVDGACVLYNQTMTLTTIGEAA